MKVAVLSVRKQLPEGPFDPTKYNDIGTFEPKRPSGILLGRMSPYWKNSFDSEPHNGLKRGLDFIALPATSTLISSPRMILTYV